MVSRCLTHGNQLEPPERKAGTSAWSEGRGRPVRPGGPAPPCGQRQTGASETPSGRMRPAAGTEHPLRGAEYSGAESVARGSLLSDHAVDVSDKLCAVSFLQLVGIKINNCLIFEEKFRDELRSTGSPPSSTTLASHRQKLVSGTSRSVRRAGSALLRQSRCLSKHRPLRGRGTRFSPSPLCVKTVRVTQCRTEEQLVGPSLTQGGGGVWHPRRGPCQERTTRWDFTSWEAAAQRRGARRAQDTGAGCRGARRGPPFMRRQDHTAVPSRPPKGPVGQFQLRTRSARRRRARSRATVAAFLSAARGRRRDAFLCPRCPARPQWVGDCRPGPPSKRGQGRGRHPRPRLREGSGSHSRFCVLSTVGAVGVPGGG